jgi:hypothetical protein
MFDALQPDGHRYRSRLRCADRMAVSRTTRVNLLISNGHFLSHFYVLTIVLINHGHPELVLVLVAAILLASLLCVGSAKASARAAPMVVFAAE